MSERKFSKSVWKPGIAAHVREQVSQVVKESATQLKMKNVEPLDFEDFVSKNRTLIQNDPLRELLLSPPDDVSQVVLPRRYRTTTPNIPQTSETNECNLFVKACLRSYSSNWNLIHYKYNSYSGTYLDLPKLPKAEDLREEIYEVDTDVDQLDHGEFTKVDGITKEGFLLKGPDVSNDRIFVNIGSKSFKRRYCYLRQQVDGTYILELHKDDKKGDAKGTIDMEFCTDVTKNLKRGRFCFELTMAGHKSATFAAENEVELQDWILKLLQVIQHNKMQEEKRSGSLERTCTTPPPSPNPPQLYGTLKGLEQSVNPQLMKYGRETDVSIAVCRKESRKRLFSVYPHIPHVKTSLNAPADPTPEPYREQFGQRVLITCDSVKFRLQAPVEGDREGLCQVEPYFTYIALFDARNNRKLTENFHFDVNHDRARAMVERGEELSVSKCLSAELSQIPEEWASFPKQAVFSISCPHPDIFIVLRIDKVLQGPINSAVDPYIRSAKDIRLGSRIHKAVKTCCQRLGRYRMPFAWTARPLFKMYSNELDTSYDFPAVYRQETNRLRDEDILRILTEFRKPDKWSKLVTIPGWAKMRVEPITELPENSLTTALVPLKPFPIPPNGEPTIEVAEFEGPSQTSVHPYTTFNNHLYVYPHSLAFDTQKNFSRARNIAVTVELRDSDTEDASPLFCMYGRPGQSLMTQKITCTVLHHNTAPVWYDEVKLRLPIHLKPQHHLLFTFYHVSCELNKKKDTAVETCVGFAWLPLLQKGRLIVDEHLLAVATHLPAGYLSIQPFGLDKGNSPPEVTWIDGQRQIFSVGMQLVSTVVTRDLHLHNLFTHLERLFDKSQPVPPSEMETCKILKASHAIHVSTAITFFPTILNELFKVLLVCSSEDVGLNLIRILIHIVHLVHDADRSDIIQSYLKFVFVSPSLPSVKATVHEELGRHLSAIFSSSNTDFLIVNKFMRHSNFFFQILIKSMVQHLLTTGRIKMHRNERFSAEYLQRIESLVHALVPSIINKHKEMQPEAFELNKSFANFLNKCLSVMDRGYVFRLISFYAESFSAVEGKVLLEMKLAFIQVITSHEHFIALNLPVQTVKFRQNRTGDSPVKDFNLSNEFRKYHYLAGLLLQEVKCSLNESGPIRRQALLTLRDLMAKHELDDRYQSRGYLTRIAGLYLPWLSVVLENLPRLNVADLDPHHNRISSSTSLVQCNSSIVSISSKPFQRFNEAPGTRASVCLKDSHLFAVIAGQGCITNGTSNLSIESDDSAGDDASTISQETTIVRENGDVVDGENMKKHVRSASAATSANTHRMDRLSLTEVKDMLLCFLFVVKYLGEDSLILWWQNAQDTTVLQFFSVIEICLHQFKYLGKKRLIAKPNIGKPVKAMTLPARMQPPDFSKTDGTSTNPSGTSSVGRDGQLAESDSARLYQALLEANMATEVGLLSLDVLGLYSVHFRENLLAHEGNNALMNKFFDIYLSFLQVGQSETLFRHVFAALRAYINNFSVALFKGNALLCGRLCYELLRCCNSRLSTVRQESCAILYLLMRSNFEYTNRKGLNRVHLQVIISISHMLGNVSGLNNIRFQESLSLINSYATSDKVMKGTGFPVEVKDLTKRIRTVLMATAQMLEHQEDPEVLMDLQHSLANSYASTPELRHTWLATMARNHLRDGNYSEAMCCQLHVTALIAEYLKLKKVQDWGAEAFVHLSVNISNDEMGLKLDSGSHDVQYNEHSLIEELEGCVSIVEKAERYELLGPLYKLITPYHERRRNYQALAQSYQNLSNAYTKVTEYNKSGKRLFGRYYRVAFLGQYFEEESGKEYIYKEPKVTPLSDISERLCKIYSEKFGRENVRIFMDSNQMDGNTMDSKLAYIQITSVTPYIEPGSHEDRQNEFEINHDVDTFMFETPFTKDGRVRANPEEQWKRRTVLRSSTLTGVNFKGLAFETLGPCCRETTEFLTHVGKRLIKETGNLRAKQYLFQCVSIAVQRGNAACMIGERKFPYVKKRVRVCRRTVTELSPIEVALDEMRTRVAELEEVVTTKPTDAKKLQLRLQGSVCVQVNAGPLAYANAFLDPAKSNNYPGIHVEALKDVFYDFVKICGSALQVNGKVIETDQVEYQEVLLRNFQKMCHDLSDLLGETVCPEITSGLKRFSQVAFSVISGGSHSSSTA